MQEQERDIRAKHGCVCQLYDGAGYGRVDGNSGIGEAKLVKVVGVSAAKYKRRQEDDAGRANLGEYQERDYGRAEEAFFSNRSLW